MKMMDCRDVLANLSCYVDGDGSTELRNALEGHMAHCRPCRVVFDTTEKTLRIVLDVEPFGVPLSVSARLYTKLEKLLAEESPVS